MALFGGQGKNWTRDETVLAYALLRSQDQWPMQSSIEELASFIGRTAGAVSFKLGNLRAAETDGAEGLPHRSLTDQSVVDEFRRDRPGLLAAAAQVRSKARPQGQRG